MARRRRETLPRWKALLGELAERDHLLIDGLMRHLEGGSRYYGGLVAEEDFKSSSIDAFRYLLGRLIEGRPPADLADLPRRIGVVRAGQGVALEGLVATVREDFTILWSTLLWVSRTTDMPVLISHVDELWRAVDDFASEVHLGYVRESAARTQLDLSRRRAMVSTLFSSADPSPGLLRQIAGTLGVPEEGVFEVVAVGHADRERLDAVIARAASGGLPAFSTDLDDAVVAFWGGAGTGALRAFGSRERLAGLRCGHSGEVEGLGAVPARARTALRILRALPPAATGPATMAEVWDRLAAEHLTSIAPDFTADLVRPLRDLPDDERTRVLETARAFLHTGSVRATAEALFCHRNTVLNRLHRFRDVTTLDLTLPRDAALATVVLTRCE
ncbi:PucR family transcriptional regulator [Nocardiopsis sediminis]|uniref:PucR family transcriptional regulator n=1 Tax=Nocardiopsis sediminis TaxID=1778267 RepID=A0ABV8FH62_9ACTN